MRESSKRDYFVQKWIAKNKSNQQIDLSNGSQWGVVQHQVLTFPRYYQLLREVRFQN